MSRALRAVLSQGSFQVKGDAIPMLGKIYQWAADLEAKISEAIKPVVIEPSIKPIGEKKKK